MTWSREPSFFFDNCGELDTFFAAPDRISCTNAGLDTLTVGVVGIDLGQNIDTCEIKFALTPVPPAASARQTNLCEGDTLFLFANPPPADPGVNYQYNWTGPNGFSSTEENPVVPLIPAAGAGDYVVEVSNDSLGCALADTVRVTVLPFAPAPNLAGPSGICQGEELVLVTDSVPSASFEYRFYEGTPPLGNLLQTGTDPFFTVPALDTGSTRFYLATFQSGCESAPSPELEVAVSEKPQSAVDQGAFSVCPRDSFQLGTPISGPDIQYDWSGPNGFFSTERNPPPIMATDSTGGRYALVTRRGGCPSDSAFVDVDVPPDLGRPLVSSNSPICEGDSLVLTSSVSGSQYTWFFPSGDSLSTILNPLLEVNATLADTGLYRVRVQLRGCASELSDPVEVEVNIPPNLTVSAAADSLCEGDSIALFAGPDLPGAVFTWRGPDNFAVTEQNPVIPDARPASSGLYLATVVDTNGCDASDIVPLTVTARPEILAIQDDNPGCDSLPRTITLSPDLLPPDNGGDYQYAWLSDRLGGVRATPTVSVDLVPPDSAEFRLAITDQQGCVSDTAFSRQRLNLTPPTPAVPVPSPAPPAGGYCSGDSLRLTVSTPGFGNGVRYLWTRSSGTDTTDVPFLRIDSLAVGRDENITVAYWLDGCLSPASSPLNLNLKARPEGTAVSNGPVCEGSPLVLTGTPGPAGGVCRWTGPDTAATACELSIDSADPGTDAGIYIFTVELDGCFSEPDTQRVEVFALPPAQTAFNDGPLCGTGAGARVTLFVDSLNAPSGATFIWFGPGNAEAGRTTSPLFQLTDLSGLVPGPNDFFVVAEVNGCTGPPSDITRVELQDAPSEESAFAGVDQTLCAGELVQLAAFPPTLSTGRWRELSGAPEVRIVAPASPDSPVDGLLAGRSYQFEWSLSSGACSDFSSDTVTVDLNAGEVADAGPNQLICPDSTTRLQAVPPLASTGEWSQSGEQALLGVVIVDPDDPASEVMGLETGRSYLFTWTLTSACGTRASTTTVSLYDDRPNAGPDQAICDELPVGRLNASPLQPGNSGRWSSGSPGVVFSDPADPGAEVRNLGPGPNVLVWSSVEGSCPDPATDTVVIRYSLPPLANPDLVDLSFQGEIALRPLDNDRIPEGATLRLLSEATLGTVSLVDSTTVVYQAGINQVGEDQVEYEVCAEGCDCDRSTITFQIGSDLAQSDADTCSVPSIMTPNGDGINDAFVVPCLRLRDNFPNNQVTIYNRWGDEVFRAAPYDDGADPTQLWRGTFNGRELPPGTYFYLVDFGDGSTTKSGWVYLTR